MIYSRDELFIAAMKCIKYLHELKDVRHDLERIEFAKYSIGSVEGIMNANRLDKELRDKYPTIDIMLSIADSLPKAVENRRSGELSQCPELDNLQQDRCGIICDVILKKEMAKSVEECFSKVT